MQFFCQITYSSFCQQSCSTLRPGSHLRQIFEMLQHVEDNDCLGTCPRQFKSLYLGSHLETQSYPSLYCVNFAAKIAFKSERRTSRIESNQRKFLSYLLNASVLNDVEAYKRKRAAVSGKL